MDSLTLLFAVSTLVLILSLLWPKIIYRYRIWNRRKEIFLVCNSSPISNTTSTSRFFQKKTIVSLGFFTNHRFFQGFFLTKPLIVPEVPIPSFQGRFHQPRCNMRRRCSSSIKPIAFTHNWQVQLQSHLYSRKHSQKLEFSSMKRVKCSVTHPSV